MIGARVLAPSPRNRTEWETAHTRFVDGLALAPSSAFWTAPSDRSHVRAALALPEGPATRRALARGGQPHDGRRLAVVRRAREGRAIGARRAILFVHVSKSGGT